MPFPCPRCEGAKETPVLAYCHCVNPVENCHCPQPKMEQCGRCKGTGSRFCEACDVQSATVATPFRPGSLLLCFFCGPCAKEDVSTEEADAWSRLNTYARQTAADMGEGLPAAVEAMRTESGEVARDTGLPEAEVEAWVRANLQVDAIREERHHPDYDEPTP